MSKIDTETGEVNATSIPINANHLRAVSLFAARGDIRYYLNGVLVHVLDNGAVRLIGTNGARPSVFAARSRATLRPISSRSCKQAHRRPLDLRRHHPHL